MSPSSILTPLTPPEHLFLAESLPMTILPLVPLPPLPLLSTPTPALVPPHRATVPLWLAILLKKQKKCHIIPPDWLSVESLQNLIKWETENPGRFGSGVPWRWVEVGEVLCEVAEDDLVAYGGGGAGAGGGVGGAAGGGGGDLGGAGSGDIRVLLRTLREVRWSKAREGLGQLESTYLQMNALGHLEISELRPYAKAVVDNLRLINASREEARAREDEEEELHGGGRSRGGSGRAGRGRYDDDDDDDDE